MSDEQTSAGSSKADRIEAWTKFIGVAGGLIAVFTGIQQFWSANVHDQRELRWNQANTALEMVNAMVEDEGWEAFEMMDWEDEGREYIINGEPKMLNVDSVYTALEKEVSSPTDHYIIDRFDRALFLISQLEAAVRSELVRVEDVRWPLSWYAAATLCPRKELFQSYISQYAAPETLHFLERLEEWRTCPVTAEHPHGAPPT